MIRSSSLIFPYTHWPSIELTHFEPCGNKAQNTLKTAASIYFLVWFMPTFLAPEGSGVIVEFKICLVHITSNQDFDQVLFMFPKVRHTVCYHVYLRMCRPPFVLCRMPCQGSCINVFSIFSFHFYQVYFIFGP